MDYSPTDDDAYSSSSENESKTIDQTKKTSHKKRKRTPENLPDGNGFVLLLNSKIKDIRPTEVKDRKVFESSDQDIEHYCLYWNYHGDKKDREVVKKVARKVNNRISASKSRKSKSDQLDQLKDQISQLENENNNFKSQIKQEKIKNDNLTEQIEKLRSIFQNIPQHQVNALISQEIHFDFQNFLNNQDYLYPKKSSIDEELSLESNDSTNEYNCSSPYSDQSHFDQNTYFDTMFFDDSKNELPILDEDNFNYMDENRFENNLFESNDGQSYYQFFSKFLLLILGLSFLFIPNSGSQIVQLSTYGSSIDFSGISHKVISISFFAIFIYECIKIWK